MYDKPILDELGRESSSEWLATSVPPVIRAYRGHDWPRLCQIHDAAQRGELASAGLIKAFLTLDQTANNEGLFDATVIVAESGGIVNGFAAYTEGELTWLYCHPACYRKGIGRALLDHVIDACRGTLHAEVLVGNEAALSLYRSVGFEVLRRVDGKLAGNEAFTASGYYLQRIDTRTPA